MNEQLDKNSKILIIGSINDFSLESIYLKTLKHLNYKVDFLNIEKSIPNRIIARIKRHFSELNYKIIRNKTILFFTENKKKYDLIIFFKSIFLDLKTLKKIKSINGKATYINIFPDDPYIVENPIISNKNFLKTINEFDFFCIWSKKILKKLKKEFKSKFIYLPFGFDSFSIPKNKKNLKKKERKKEINFIGTFDNERLNILDSIKIKKKIYGGNWYKLYRTKLSNAEVGSHIYGYDIFKLMNTSAISLNILRKQNYSAHNMRTFEIPANNGLMLTTRSNDQNEFFKENKACYMYSSNKELNMKIKLILENPKKAEKVRKLGNFIVKKHTYINRVKFLLKEINKK